MRTTDEKCNDIDKAELEIKLILEKYNVSITSICLSDIGMIEIIATDEHESGDLSVCSRKLDI